MRNEKGVTLIILIITIILLAIIAGLSVINGVDTYENSKIAKFESYMKIIQKKVDVFIEEDIDYTTLGSDLTEDQKVKLIDALMIENYLETTVNSEELKVFSPTDIENVFGIIDISDEIVVNFANREVISLNGVEKNGSIYYTEYRLH